MPSPCGRESPHPRPRPGRRSDTSFQGILGSTDSEHFFALFQDELAPSDSKGSGSQRMAEAFRRALTTILELQAEHAPDEETYLNAVVTDGSSTLVSRFTTDEPERSSTLFMIRGRQFVCTDGVCHMVGEGEGDEAVLVSSEPLSRGLSQGGKRSADAALEPRLPESFDWDRFAAGEAN